MTCIVDFRYEKWVLIQPNGLNFEKGWGDPNGPLGFVGKAIINHFNMYILSHFYLFSARNFFYVFVNIEKHLKFDPWI